MQHLQKWGAVGILILILLLSLAGLVSVDTRIFSSGLTDTYTPRKGLVIERNPIRIVYFGEITHHDKNETTKYGESFVNIIRELNKMTAVPTIPMNETLLININTGVKSDSNRESYKGINVGGTKE